jgi:hypothetical protein
MYLCSMAEHAPTTAPTARLARNTPMNTPREATASSENATSTPAGEGSRFGARG